MPVWLGLFSLSSDAAGSGAVGASAASAKIELHQTAKAAKPSHNLANHGMLPDEDDIRELLVYLTLLFIVLSWMLREIHIAFFTEDSESNESRRRTRAMT